MQLVQQAGALGISFRAVVADCFYGEHDAFTHGVRDAGVGYVLALQPSHAWWHPVDEPGTVWEVAQAAGWRGPPAPGAWVKVERRFQDGHPEAWWAVDLIAGPYGPAHEQRAVVATTDPVTLPDRTTWYLETNLPAPDQPVRLEQGLTAANLAEVVRLYSLRMWIEQSYKQMKHALGWAQYQVRSDLAIRRHWALVYCAFSFCWWQYSGNLALAVAGTPAQAATPREGVKKRVSRMRPHVER